MNVHEIAAVLHYLGSSWPSWDMSDDNADVWGSELLPLEADAARAAARNLVQSSKFPPSIAEFLIAYREVTVRRRITAVPALPEPKGDGKVPHDMIATLRAQLNDWSARGHNHKGPEPCPVCHPAPEPEPA